MDPDGACFGQTDNHENTQYVCESQISSLRHYGVPQNLVFGSETMPFS